MRQYLIVSWIHLILFVVNFALAAPLVTRGRYEVRVDVVKVAKDGTAASQTLSRFGPRGDAWSGSNGNGWENPYPGPESSDDGSSREPGQGGLWSGSGSNFNSPITHSGSTSPSESPSFPFHGPIDLLPASGGGMSEHNAIAGASAGANPSSPESNPSSPEQSPSHPPTESLSEPTHPESMSPGHAMPQWPPPWPFDEPPPSTWYDAPKEPPHMPPDFLWTGYLHPPESPSNSHPYSTGSEYSHSTGSDNSHSSSSGTSHDSSPSNSIPIDASASSSSAEYTPPQTPGQTDNHPPPSPPSNPAPSTGPQQPTDGLPQASPEQQSPAEPEFGTFLNKLWKGKITAPVL